MLWLVWVSVRPGKTAVPGCSSATSLAVVHAGGAAAPYAVRLGEHAGAGDIRLGGIAGRPAVRHPFWRRVTNSCILSAVQREQRCRSDNTVLAAVGW